MKLNESDFEILNNVVKLLMSSFEMSTHFKQEKAKDLRMIIRKIKRDKTDKEIYNLKKWFKNELVRLMYIKESEIDNVSLDMLLNQFIKRLV